MNTAVSTISQDGKEFTLHEAIITTPLGPMLAVADDVALYMLDFADRQVLADKRLKLRHRYMANLHVGENEVIALARSELKAYFAGSLHEFATPIMLSGSPFQKMVWQELLTIPYGQTISYAVQAQRIAKHTAYRAVGNANGANPLSIIVPCHRVIASNGLMGGYGGGIDRKLWLLAHERQHRGHHE